MKTEINLSKSYEMGNTTILTNLSRFNENKSLLEMNRENIIAFLNSFRREDKIDPFHKWIGTYNQYLLCITRFFKWLHNPTLEPKQRSKPEVVQNLHRLKRREQSTYKPTDLWSLEDDLLFLKFCSSIRDRCYHTISRDLSARPHEILSLKIKDIIFKRVGDKQYAECLVNGKTGTRHLPLIDSLPYLKDWLDQHPQRNNHNSYLICSMDRKNFAGQMSRFGMIAVYKNYKDHYFPKLLKTQDTSTEDKQKITELLKKPWNPYVRRHSSLTQKSTILKEHVLRQYAGWSPRSQMHLKYLHYYGNESNNVLLQEYGILPKDNAETNVLKPKQCPNCNEPNKPDQKFCVKCKLALTFEAYTENDESQREQKVLQEAMLKRIEVLETLIRNPKQLMEMASKK